MTPGEPLLSAALVPSSEPIPSPRRPRLHRLATYLSGPRFRFILAFWLLGLLNNASYVVMNAGAKNISEGSVALVYLANILPGFAIKSTSPYWLDSTPYWLRLGVGTAFMVISFCVVALSSNMWVQLVGVAFSAAQCSLGEASLLALASKYDAAAALSAWSSGTGFAGVFGYAWVAFFHLALKLEFSVTLLCANVLAASYAAVFFILLPKPTLAMQRVPTEEEVEAKVEDAAAKAAAKISSEEGQGGVKEADGGILAIDGEGGREEGGASSPPTRRERFCMLPSLWRFTIPLFLVYFSEYAMQSGTWAAIGIPNVHSIDDREDFYTFANWAYQGGVFISRSSSMLIPIRSIAFLWLMPILQCIMLIFFSAVAMMPNATWVYNWWLVAPCFFTGLLGGAVYVNAFTQIAVKTPPRLKELAIATASLADNVGIVASNVAGLAIQACLFKYNGIPDATIRCSL